MFRSVLFLISFLLVGCIDFSLLRYESTGVEESTSVSVLPFNVGMPGDAAIKAMAEATAERDVLIEKLRVQDAERADTEEQIEVVTAQINIIPLFSEQEQRLTLALNQDRITTADAQRAFDLAVLGKQSLDVMIQAQKDRNDTVEAEERSILVAITGKIKSELDRLGV